MPLAIRESLKQQAQLLIRSRYGRHPLWGYKDPRTVLTLAFWQELLRQENYEDAYVIALRNPLSVAASLAKIDAGFDVRRSCIFWLLRSTAAVTGIRDRPCVVVNYDTLLADPPGQLRRVANALSLPWTPSVAQSVNAYAEEFLAPDLRHSSYGLQELHNHPAVPPVVYRVYESMAAMADDRCSPTDAQVQALWMQINREIEDFGPLLEYCQDLETQLGRHISQTSAAPGVLHQIERKLQHRIRQWLR